MTTTDLPLPLIKQGKVRDVYDLEPLTGEPLILIVVTDRVSALNFELKPGIPGQGPVLVDITRRFNQMIMSAGIETHLLDLEHQRDVIEEFFAGDLKKAVAELEGRLMICHKADLIPYECVVREFLTGSGWKAYQKDGIVCGVHLPRGLGEFAFIPGGPVFTPTEKSATDPPVTFEQIMEAIGFGDALFLRNSSIFLHILLAGFASSRGFLMLDQKFEYGRRKSDGKIILVDEWGTPHSSRLVTEASWQKFMIREIDRPESFDKDPIRRWLGPIVAELPDGGQPPEIQGDLVGEMASRFQAIRQAFCG